MEGITGRILWTRVRFVPHRCVLSRRKATGCWKMNAHGANRARRLSYDTRRILITAPCDTVRILDFEITLTPWTCALTVPTILFRGAHGAELNVASGGTLANARGDKGERRSAGISLCDYYGEQTGLRKDWLSSNPSRARCIPSNGSPRLRFSLHSLYWPPNETHVSLSSGISVTLRYRVVVHAGTTEEAGVAEYFSRYSEGTEIGSLKASTAN